MAIKNIILTFIAVLAVLNIPADRPLVSDSEALNAISFESQSAETGVELVAGDDRIVVMSAALPAAVLNPVSTLPSYAAPVSIPDAITAINSEIVNKPETTIKPEASDKREPAPKKETGIGIPKVVKLPEVSRGFLVSEWLDVPRDVAERVKALPVPAVPKPSIIVFTLTATTQTGFSSAISKRQLLPLLPKSLIAMPMTRPISLTENASLKGSRTVFTRHLMPLLPEPAVTKPSIRIFSLTETTATNISSRLNTRQLLPLLPDLLAARPVVGSFELSAATASNMSSKISARQLSPLLPEPAIAKPTLRSFSLAEISSSKFSFAITERPLLVLLPEPVITKPTARSLSFVETTASLTSSVITTRPLQPLLLEPEIAKPSLRVFSLSETASSQVSATMTKRSLMPLPPELFSSNLTAETTLSQVSQSIGMRALMPPLPDSLTRTAVLTETISSPFTSSLLGRQMQQLLVQPFAKKEKKPSVEVTAVTKPVSATINAQLTAVNVLSARDQDPILISGQRALNPFGIIPLPSEMLFSEVETKPASGPSLENALANDKANETKRTAEPLPLLITAQNGFSVDMLRPMSSKPVFPPNPNSGAPLVIAENTTSSVPDGNYCDANFQGQPIRFSQTVELKLEDLLNQLNSRFGVNFIIGPGIGELPLNVKAGSIPWNVLLRSQLYVSGVRATCIDKNTIELVLNSKVAELEKAKVEAEKLETKYIKLKYLQPAASGNKNIAGQSTGGASGSSGAGGSVLCQSASSSGGQGGSALGFGGGGGGDQLPQRCKFERLMSEIRQILGLNTRTSAPDDGGLFRRNVVTIDQSSSAPATADVPKQAYVGQVPGRNMLIVNATTGQLREIDELIKRADVPPWQVVIKGLVYTANEDKLKDIGVQTTITDLGSGKTTGGLFGHTLGALGTLFDFSTIIGTVQFQVQANAFQRDGVISIKSRPFATVLDGNTTDLTVGRQVPVLIQAVNPIGGAAPGTLQILQAANLLSVTPHVIDDDQGNPTGVNLELQLESNDVDQSVDSQGVPAISVRSIQSNFNLNLEQTAILGGFTVDSDSKTISKTPGLGDIPIIGELFKRRVRAQQINRLYFAISVTVIPYGGTIEPVTVPGATTVPPSLTPDLKKRADAAEPQQVADPK